MDSTLFTAREEPLFADVILPLNLPQTLTYGVPHELREMVQVGIRAEVALGKNKVYAAIISRLHHQKPDAFSVKPIRSLLDKEPVVNEQQMKLWNWIADYYIAAPGEVMQAALPAHLKLMNETRLEWHPQHDDIFYEWSSAAWPAVQALQQRREMTLSEVREVVGVFHLTTVIHELLENESVLINDGLTETYKPKKEKIISLSPDYQSEEGLHRLFDQLQRAPRQQELVMAYIELSRKNTFVSQTTLLARASASGVQLKTLLEKGIFLTEEVYTDRLGSNGTETPREIILTPAQQTACSSLSKALDEGKVALLHGVTGSGKTLLYIDKIKECLSEGKQALFLLPEIGLTTQLVNRLYAYFGDELGVYHSRFSDNERVEIWEKVRRKQYKVVVGARSALWLPFDRLGLIVVDEEHDASYKQKDPAPRFHARDAAVYLATLHQSKVILGSATPSVETLYNVRQKKYACVQLAERYQGVQLPAIYFADARSLYKTGNLQSGIITAELHAAMEEAIRNHKQVILFQNRRGYSPFQICTVCGWVPQCRNCAVALTYHKSTDQLHCHYCGLKSKVVYTCASCGSNRIVSKSFGTEKIEEEVRSLFPRARVARMDLDSMRGKKNINRLLEDMDKLQVDVLVGTQMVVKGLDFGHVGLVGILSADSLLSYPDFRVNERAFQLMEQVSGRAGRSDGAGRVIIQTYNREHIVLQWVAAHDINAFFEHEIHFREQFAYPPFSRFIKLIFRHKNEPKAIAAARQVADELQSIKGIGIQGPAPALIARIRDQYIQELWIKCPRDMQLLEQVKDFLRNKRQALSQQKGMGLLQLIIDVDPY